MRDGQRQCDSKSRIKRVHLVQRFQGIGTNLDTSSSLAPEVDPLELGRPRTCRQNLARCKTVRCKVPILVSKLEFAGTRNARTCCLISHQPKTIRTTTGDVTDLWKPRRKMLPSLQLPAAVQGS